MRGASFARGPSRYVLPAIDRSGGRLNGGGGEMTRDGLGGALIRL